MGSLALFHEFHPQTPLHGRDQGSRGIRGNATNSHIVADKVTIQASVPGADGQQLGAGAEEQLDNRPDPRAREAYAFFQHGATELTGGYAGGWRYSGASEGLFVFFVRLSF